MLLFDLAFGAGRPACGSSRLTTSRWADHESKITTLDTTPHLTAREVYQVLKDVSIGTRTIRRACRQSWSEIYHGLMPGEIDGWRLTLFNDCDSLEYCEDCKAPECRVGTLEIWQHYDADPVEIFSV